MFGYHLIPYLAVVEIRAAVVADGRSAALVGRSSPCLYLAAAGSLRELTVALRAVKGHDTVIIQLSDVLHLVPYSYQQMRGLKFCPYALARFSPMLENTSATFFGCRCFLYDFCSSTVSVSG